MLRKDDGRKVKDEKKEAEDTKEMKKGNGGEGEKEVAQKGDKHQYQRDLMTRVQPRVAKQ